MSIHSSVFYTNLYSGCADTWKLWRNRASYCRNLTDIAFSVLTLGLAACGSGPSVRIEVGTQSALPLEHDAFVVAGEPQAGLVAVEILKSGGSAADAAVSLGFSLAVTLPSSAGLGADGYCLRYGKADNSADVLEFFNRPGSANYPRFVGGMYSLYAKHGSLPWAQLVSPAENLARFGVSMSEALASDMELDGYGLLGQSGAAEIFMTAEKSFLKAGDQLVQPQLAQTIGAVRSQYSAGLNAIEFKSRIASEIKNMFALDGRDLDTSHVPTWSSLNSNLNMGERSVLYKPYARNDSDKASTKVMNEIARAPAGTTSFIVGDRQGNIVTCTLSIGESFGSKILVPTLGFFLHSSVSDKHTANVSVASAVLIKETAQGVALIASSFGSGAGKKLRSLLALAKRSENKNESMKTHLVGVNLVRCRLTLTRERIGCHANAGATSFGYAAIVDLE